MQGNLPTKAGIVQPDASTLSSFLDDYGGASGFELGYTEDGQEQTRLLHDVSLKTERLERPSNAPGICCRPASPSEGRFVVAVDAIEMLSVVELPAEAYTANAQSPAEKAEALRRLADDSPETVRVSSVLSLLDCETVDPLSQSDALRALRLVAGVRPEDCRPAVPILRSLLDGDDLAARGFALGTLRRIGDADPADIAPATDAIVPYLDSSSVTAREEATRCIATVATEFPEDVVDAVPALATIIEEEADGWSHAVHALSRITTENPETVEPVAETVRAIVLDESRSEKVRLNATAALGRVVSDSPSLAVDIVPDIVRLFDADSAQLQNNAVALLSDVATVHTDVVEPYTDDIAVFLTADEIYSRINASATLARIAQDFPRSVGHHAPTFVELLLDENEVVRKYACWALGYLDARETQTALRERALDDTNEDVRRRAEWALARVSQTG